MEKMELALSVYEQERKMQINEARREEKRQIDIACDKQMREVDENVADIRAEMAELTKLCTTRLSKKFEQHGMDFPYSSQGGTKK